MVSWDTLFCSPNLHGAAHELKNKKEGLILLGERGGERERGKQEEREGKARELESHKTKQTFSIQQPSLKHLRCFY